MKRRNFLKGVAAVPAAGALLSSSSLLSAKAASAKAGKAAGKASSGAGKVPDFAKHQLLSDNQGLGPDGKPTG